MEEDLKKCNYTNEENEKRFIDALKNSFKEVCFKTTDLHLERTSILDKMMKNVQPSENIKEEYEYVDNSLKENYMSSLQFLGTFRNWIYNSKDTCFEEKDILNIFDEMIGFVKDMVVCNLGMYDLSNTLSDECPDFEDEWTDRLWELENAIVVEISSAIRDLVMLLYTTNSNILVSVLGISSETVFEIKRIIHEKRILYTL